MKPLIIEQKITAFANQYRVYECDAEGNKGTMLAFAHQKRLAFREKIEFFTSEARDNLAFTVQAEKVMDIHGRFFVSDPRGQRLGAVRKVFKESLLRSTWEILDNSDQPVLTLRERSKGIAIFRRIWAFVPYIGDLPFFLKYHFDFVKPGEETVVARYEKTTLFYDHYRLVVEAGAPDVDWRVVAAECVLLDALQGR
jgi:uncharacterized protein YxjI